MRSMDKPELVSKWFGWKPPSEHVRLIQNIVDDCKQQAIRDYPVFAEISDIGISIDELKQLIVTEFKTNPELFQKLCQLSSRDYTDTTIRLQKELKIDETNITLRDLYIEYQQKLVIEKLPKHISATGEHLNWIKEIIRLDEITEVLLLTSSFLNTQDLKCNSNSSVLYCVCRNQFSNGLTSLSYIAVTPHKGPSLQPDKQYDITCGNILGSTGRSYNIATAAYPLLISDPRHCDTAYEITSTLGEIDKTPRFALRCRDQVIVIGNDLFKYASLLRGTGKSPTYENAKLFLLEAIRNTNFKLDDRVIEVNNDFAQLTTNKE